MEKNNEKILSFEFNKKTESLEIHLNQNGLKYFKNIIENLEKIKAPEHIHLMSPDWGGEEISSDKIGTDNEKLNHVKMFLWED